jgi:DNA-binding PadR family transcriptional regulator
MTLEIEIENNLPLSESTFLILLSLASGPKHGYAILKDVAALSRGRVELSTGTLYGALKRLLAGDWIARAEEAPASGRDAAGPGRPRRTYALTCRGRRLLEAELARLRSLVAVASRQAQEMQA